MILLDQGDVVEMTILDGRSPAEEVPLWRGSSLECSPLHLRRHRRPFPTFPTSPPASVCVCAAQIDGPSHSSGSCTLLPLSSPHFSSPSTSSFSSASSITSHSSAADLAVPLYPAGGPPTAAEGPLTDWTAPELLSHAVHYQQQQWKPT